MQYLMMVGLYVTLCDHISTFLPQPLGHSVEQQYSAIFNLCYFIRFIC